MIVICMTLVYSLQKYRKAPSKKKGNVIKKVSSPMFLPIGRATF